MARVFVWTRVDENTSALGNLVRRHTGSDFYFAPSGYGAVGGTAWCQQAQPNYCRLRLPIPRVLPAALVSLRL
jgi:hypothetical protein